MGIREVGSLWVCVHKGHGGLTSGHLEWTAFGHLKEGGWAWERWGEVWNSLCSFHGGSPPLLTQLHNCHRQPICHPAL